jgi:hypothetical protein
MNARIVVFSFAAVVAAGALVPDELDRFGALGY